jgi:hypothetical protein
VSSLDLEANLSRTGYRGPHEPTLETLRALPIHPPGSSVMFESLDVLRMHGFTVTPWLDLAGLTADGTRRTALDQASIARGHARFVQFSERGGHFTPTGSAAVKCINQSAAPAYPYVLGLLRPAFCRRRQPCPGRESALP